MPPECHWKLWAFIEKWPNLSETLFLLNVTWNSGPQRNGLKWVKLHDIISVQWETFYFTQLQCYKCLLLFFSSNILSPKNKLKFVLTAVCLGHFCQYIFLSHLIFMRVQLSNIQLYVPWHTLIHMVAYYKKIYNIRGSCNCCLDHKYGFNYLMGASCKCSQFGAAWK